MMRFRQRLVLALVMGAPLVLLPAPAEAELVQGVVVSPGQVSPGDPLTLSGPAVNNEAHFCQVTATGNGTTYFFGPARTNMQAPWTMTAQGFGLFGGGSIDFPVGTYTVGIACTNNTGTQELHETTATITVVPLPPPDPNGYQALTPARLLDTRPGGATVDTQMQGGGPVGPGAELTLKVTARGGVPESGVKAVVLNVTATQPSAGGYLTAYPTGEARPLASNLNFAAGKTVPNLVVAKVGAGGQVTIFNATGSTHLIADVTGWFPTGAAFTPLSPARLLDTRPGQTTVDGLNAGSGSVGPGGLRTIRVLGRGAVPSSGVSAVILNVTVTAPTAFGFATVYPAGQDRPLASNLNFAPGQTVANSVVARVGADGSVNLYNDTGSTHLIADVAGWFPTTSSFNALSPVRIMDTRAGQDTIDFISAGEGPIGPDNSRSLKVTGRAGVPPARVSAVVLNVTATSSTAGGYLTVYPAPTPGANEPRPLASNLNFEPGQTTANLVIAKVGYDGRVQIYNASGSTDVVVDIAGWYAR